MLKSLSQLTQSASVSVLLIIYFKVSRPKDERHNHEGELLKNVASNNCIVGRGIWGTMRYVEIHIL